MAIARCEFAYGTTKELSYFLWEIGMFQYLRINRISGEVEKTNDYSKLDHVRRNPDYWIVIDLHVGRVLDNSIEGTPIKEAT